MTPTVVVSLIVAWVTVGLVSCLWTARRGHDPLWILIALPLGPLFVPIALERVQRRPAQRPAVREETVAETHRGR